MRRVVRASILTLLAIVLMGAPVAASAKTTAGAADTNVVAPASSAVTLSGWLGRCYPQFPNSWTAGGWCDGNGPDWTYPGGGPLHQRRQLLRGHALGRRP